MMVNNVIGMVVGAAIDREDGDSGIKGAVAGYLVEGALKVAVPLVVTYAIGWGVQYGLRRALHALTDDPKLAKGAASPDVGEARTTGGPAPFRREWLRPPPDRSAQGARTVQPSSTSFT